MTFRYGVYGLTIEADAPIDGALPATASTTTPDLHVRMQATPPFAAGDALFDDENVSVYREGGAYAFHYRDGTRFVIENGARTSGPKSPDVHVRRPLVEDRPADQTSAGCGPEVRAPIPTIWCAWPESSTPEDTATYLLGPILAFALRLRGTLSLHSSAVVLGGRAVAIAAPPSGGKSTAAAAFADRGARVITDDVLPIVWRHGQPWAFSGYPRIRLWPETVRARHGSEEALPLLTPTWSKRYLDVSAQFQRDPLPLGAIVILRERVAGAPIVAPLAGHAAAMQLVANSSMALYLDPQMRADELEGVASLVKSVPLFAASASEDIARAGELCEAIAQAVVPRKTNDLGGALSSPR